jgi:hypothetical protein
VLFEVAVGAAGAVATVEADGTGGGIAAQAQITPGLDFLGVTTLATLGENGVNLLHAEGLDGVPLVYEHGQGVDGHRHLGGLVAELLFELVAFFALHLPAHGPQLAGAFDEGRRGGGGTLAFHLNLHVGVFLVETLHPEGHQVVQGVRADGVEVAADAGNLLVGGDLGVHLDVLGGGGHAHQGGQQGLGQGSNPHGGLLQWIRL